MYIDGVQMLGWSVQCLYGPGGTPRIFCSGLHAYGDSADSLLGAMVRERLKRRNESTTGSGKLQDTSW